MTERFLLDTETVSFALRGEGRVGQTILRHRPSVLCVSAISVAELRFGAERRKSAKLHALLDAFFAGIAVLPFDVACAVQFASIAADLERRGSPIGELDVLIAAHAVAVGATLVTNNVKHFSRVRGLNVENWT